MDDRPHLPWGRHSCLPFVSTIWMIDRTTSASHLGLASMSESNGDNSIQLDSRNAAYVEGLLEEYLQDPASVPPVWQQYFRELTDGNGEVAGRPAPSQIQADQRLQSERPGPAAARSRAVGAAIPAPRRSTRGRLSRPRSPRRQARSARPRPAKSAAAEPRPLRPDRRRFRSRSHDHLRRPRLATRCGSAT